MQEAHYSRIAQEPYIPHNAQPHTEEHTAARRAQMNAEEEARIYQARTEELRQRQRIRNTRAHREEQQ